MLCIEQFKARSRVGETAIPTISSKAWVAWFLSCLHPAKECLESQIHSFLSILQNLSVNAFQIQALSFPEGKQLTRIGKRKKSLVVFPRVFSKRKRLVIDPAANFQGLSKSCSLALGWLQAILEGFHLSSVLRHSYSTPFEKTLRYDMVISIRGKFRCVLV